MTANVFCWLKIVIIEKSNSAQMTASISGWLKMLIFEISITVLNTTLRGEFAKLRKGKFIDNDAGL